MGKVYSFADLIPEPIVVRDDRFGGEGTAHDMLTVDMFGPTQVAQLTRWFSDIQDASGRLRDVQEGDFDGVEAEARLIDQRLREMVLVLIPTLPRERMDRYPTGALKNLIDWWQTQQPNANGMNGSKPPGEAGAKAGKKNSRSKRASSSRG